MRRASGQDVEGHLDTSGCAPRDEDQAATGTIFRGPREAGGTGSLTGTAEVSALTRSGSLPRDPSFSMDLCLSLGGKVMPW